jgi:hypothetical protein
MPNLSLKSLHRNPYLDSEACVYINHLIESSAIDDEQENLEKHKNITDNFIKKLNKELKQFQATSVGLNEQGCRIPCVFMQRKDGAPFSDPDLKNLNKEITNILKSMNKTPIFFAKPKIKNNEKTPLKQAMRSYLS